MTSTSRYLAVMHVGAVALIAASAFFAGKEIPGDEPGRAGVVAGLLEGNDRFVRGQRGTAVASFASIERSPMPASVLIVAPTDLAFPPADLFDLPEHRLSSLAYVCGEDAGVIAREAATVFHRIPVSAVVVLQNRGQDKRATNIDALVADLRVALKGGAGEEGPAILVGTVDGLTGRVMTGQLADGNVAP
jgi:hypothetical protein